MVPCGRAHLEMLHASKNAYCNANNVVSVSVAESGDVVLLGVQEVEVRAAQGRKAGILFFDSGSTLTLCRHEWAREAGYVGRPISLFMKVLSKSYKEVKTLQYEVELLDKDGKLVKVWAVGLDRLTQEAPTGDLSSAYAQFPSIPREKLERPCGPIDILMGQDYAGYLPRVEESHGHLLRLSSQFGTGHLLSGRTGKE